MVVLDFAAAGVIYLTVFHQLGIPWSSSWSYGSSRIVESRCWPAITLRS